MDPTSSSFSAQPLQQSICTHVLYSDRQAEYMRECVTVTYSQVLFSGWFHTIWLIAARNYLDHFLSSTTTLASHLTFHLRFLAA